MVKTGEKTTGTALGYEQARDELVEVVRRLETGGTTLEESLALWERGEELAQVCRRWLDGARARLDAALTEGAEPSTANAEGGPTGTTDDSATAPD
ncbi:exodeoxyribonuclease VII small subunit [Streptomyces sp. HSW2009]|uniref:exodeoxyribonuclease VII small subunit n=1 Tax=Streptomyces sp. HSW2009 TaxID=3142890 RepID=UPI0032EF4B5E